METKRLSTKQVIGRLIVTISCLAVSIQRASAQTIYFADDFEQGLGQWTVGGDTWQATELFYRSGGHCVSDSPQGNYAINANSIMAMKMQYRVNLSTSVFPVLSFWHRVNVYSGDYGYIEISQDNGFTWNVLTSFTDTWRSTWSREQVDLSAYKSSPILIRFRLRANADGSTSSGWDIDDVAIRELDAETLAFPLFDDFENGTDNWAFGGWQPTISYSRSPTHSMTESNNSNYPKNASSDLILAHPIDLSTSVFPVLSFWHRIGVHDGDHGRVEVSEDNGFSWHGVDPNEPEGSRFTDLWYASWVPELMDLSAYKSSPILIRFRLRANADGSTSSGWDIDDVEIRELFYPPLEYSLIVQITGIDNSQCPGIQSTVLVTDVNGVAVGGLDASNFSVYEDARRQTPITVEPSLSDIAVSFALDYSASMGDDAIADMEAAAVLFVDLMSPEDAGEIIKFANGIEVVQEYTNDKVALIDAIQRPSAVGHNATQLYDAMYQGISDIAEQSGRKAVVAMSDGKNNNSQYGASQVIDYAESTDVSVFTIGLGSSVDEEVLRAIAVKTGGVCYFAPTSEDLVAIYQAIAGTLKNQYVVTYETGVCEPDNPDGLEHELEITVNVGVAYGQGAKRFTCPTSCSPGAGGDVDPDGTTVSQLARTSTGGDAHVYERAVRP